MVKRAQSALEYMMTYGWAILIIVIVAAVLYSLGVFNPSSAAGNTPTGFSPFVVQQGAFTCNLTGLFIQLGNGAGQSVTFLNATASAGTGLNASTATATKPSANTVVANGNTFIMKLPQGCTTGGARYSDNVLVWYSETTGLGTQNLRATGQVSGAAS